ncbi:ZIP zinc transporter-domain-containing protein [Podospora didyma]|uniref:ZIP zinc transporter-domain-containing protein n=1 Tax=Podospora didyma TaxID=330526 RepID=A0AAE0KEL7_9PEZI|nr:ZIP zinc transporter-domain-containing protein [Podospora didyma]
MNRPSRTDDDFEHPDWNQMPPFLAPDLTTRQDLNGIANARVQRSRFSGMPDASFGFLDDKNLADMNRPVTENRWPGSVPAPAMNGCLVTLPFIAPRTVLGGEGQARLSLRSTRPQSSSWIWGWVWWFASVFVAAAFVNMAGAFLPAAMSSFRAVMPSTQSIVGTAESTSPRRSLMKRSSDACATQGASPSDYNVPLHVGALFIIFGVSSLACAIPLFAAKFPFLRIPEPFLFAVRHFGTGILLATAFVHLLPTAFISLGNPCLSSFWTMDYPAMPGAIALFGIFFVTVIEMVFSPVRQFTPRPGEAGDSGGGYEKKKTTKPTTGGHCSHSTVVAAVTRPRRGSSATEPASHGSVAANSYEQDMLREESQSQGLTDEQLHKKAILQCMLLEVGILFHSVFIGMALSVSIGGDFVVLLIAIAFHQTFEGLALGARIASIEWPEKTLQPWLMVLAYGCTTPIGQAIGLATHTLYSPDSEFGLILVGTMNAVSSGLLVFASLIELLAEDFLSDHSWATLRGKRRAIACTLVLFGAICMSLVGAWA